MLWGGKNHYFWKHPYVSPNLQLHEIWPPAFAEANLPARRVQLPKNFLRRLSGQSCSEWCWPPNETNGKRIFQNKVDVWILWLPYFASLSRNAEKMLGNFQLVSCKVFRIQSKEGARTFVKSHNFMKALDEFSWKLGNFQHQSRNGVLLQNMP